MHRAVLPAALLAFALMAPPAAAAPTVVSQKGFLVQQFDVAGGGAARSASVWSGYRRQRGRTTRGVYGRVATGTALRRIQRLDRRGTDPRVAVAPDGSAVAVWARGTRLRHASAPRGRAFGRARTLSAEDSRVDLGGVAISVGGRTVVAWRQGTEVRAAVRRSGRFGRPVTLGSTRFAPSVAAATNGQIVVTWDTFPGSAGAYGIGPQVMAAVLQPGATAFRAPVELTDGRQGEFPDAFGGRGGAVVTWTEAPDRLVRRLAPDATFGPALRLRPGVVGDVEFAVPRDGGAVAVWSRESTPESPLQRPVVEAAVETGGAFGATRLLSDADYSAQDVAAGDLGDRALLAWKEQRPGRRARLRAVIRSATAWSNAVTLSQGSVIGDVQIGTGTRGAVVAWVERERSGTGRLHLQPLR